MEINQNQSKVLLERDIPLGQSSEKAMPFAIAIHSAADDGEAIPLERFAAERSVPRELVWSQIQAGRLRARVKAGVVYIMQQIDENKPLEIEPTETPLAQPEPVVQTQLAPTVSGVELKALLEHLTAAKAEQRELAQLTRTTIEQIRFMSQELVSFKDRMLSEKEEKISHLEKQITRLEDEAKALRRAHEDLETLARAFEKASEENQ